MAHFLILQTEAMGSFTKMLQFSNDLKLLSTIVGDLINYGCWVSDEKYGHNSSAVLIKISWSSVSFDETNLAYPRASMGFSQLSSISSVKSRKNSA